LNYNFNQALCELIFLSLALIILMRHLVNYKEGVYMKYAALMSILLCLATSILPSEPRSPEISRAQRNNDLQEGLKDLSKQLQQSKDAFQNRAAAHIIAMAGEIICTVLVIKTCSNDNHYSICNSRFKQFEKSCKAYCQEADKILNDAENKKTLINREIDAIKIDIEIAGREAQLASETNKQ
jgi:hypothetical protein